MNKSFSDWHRHLAVDVNNLPLNDLSAGVVAVVKDLDENAAIELARLAMGVACSEDDFVVRFRDTIRAHDASLPESENEPHEQVLAGACVIELLENGNAEISEFASLAVSCLAFGRGECDQSGPPVRQCSETFLARRSTEIREEGTTSSPSLKLSPPKKELDTLAKALIENEINWLDIPLREALEGILRTASAGIKAEAKAHRELEARLDVQAEETNIVWWLFGGASRELTQPWSKIKLSAATILAGKELSDLTEFTLGPVGADAFLDKVLSDAKRAKGTEAKRISLKAAVNELPRDWREDFVKLQDIAALANVLPVASAIQASVRVAPKDDWCKSFEHCTGTSAEVTHPAMELAVQVYRECLLHYAWALKYESD